MSVEFVKHEQRGRYPIGKAVVLEWRAMPVPHEEVDEPRDSICPVLGDVSPVVGHPCRLGNAGVIPNYTD
jgi:hypothetical protein